MRKIVVGRLRGRFAERLDGSLIDVDVGAFWDGSDVRLREEADADVVERAMKAVREFQEKQSIKRARGRYPRAGVGSEPLDAEKREILEAELR